MPKFHVSEQKPDSREGAHSEYVESIPTYLLEIPEKFNVSCYIMVEAKMKEKAVMKLFDKYFERKTVKRVVRHELKKPIQN